MRALSAASDILAGAGAGDAVGMVVGIVAGVVNGVAGVVVSTVAGIVVARTGAGEGAGFSAAFWPRHPAAARNRTRRKIRAGRSIVIFLWIFMINTSSPHQEPGWLESHPNLYL